MGRYDEALEELRTARQRDPNDPDALDGMARVLIIAPAPGGDPNKGVELARQAVALDPGSTAYLATLAQAYAAAGDVASAQATMDRALKLAPSDSLLLRQQRALERR